jgi:LAS superfamily LD-carboxypeptidase LdcB
MKRKYKLAIVFVAILCIGGLYAYDVWGSALVRNSVQHVVRQISNTEITVSHQPIEPKEKSVELLFLGDTMLDRGVLSSVRRNFDGDFKKLFVHVQEYFNTADIVFLNLEGPISDKGKNVGSKYSFRMNPVVANVLADVGVSIVSFANNHVGDWGIQAFTDTLDRLQNVGILVTGAGRNDVEATRVSIIEKNGIVFGFLGFSDVGPDWLRATENSAGQLLARDTRLTSLIQQAKEKVDVVIVSFHFGDEYVGASERQKKLARSAIDAGATLVIGHHPHVIQEIEEYNNGLIAYSLGNFIFDQYFSEHTMRGMMLSIVFEDKDNWSYHPYVVELDRTYQPIRVRDMTPADIVKKRISTPDLCPRTPPGNIRNILFPVSHTRSLGSYAPPKLIHMNNRVDARGTATCLDEEAGFAFERMVNDALGQGLKIVMVSGYRDVHTQSMLYSNARPTLSGLLSVAKPGHSEHQLGTAVDMKSGSIEPFTFDAFQNSPEYRWLQDNGHRYGFVQSYEIGKESITGYIPEAWHWRYVGIDIATAVRRSGLTLVEFLEDLENSDNLDEIE